MKEPANLTDSISHLRDRKGGSAIMSGTPSNTPQPSCTERKFATDYFLLFVYSLLGLAMLAQLFLIVWLDFV